MKPGHAYAWGGQGKTLASEAFGGVNTNPQRTSVAAGGMPYEDEGRGNNNRTNPTCAAIRKDGEPCESWAVAEQLYCQGHINQLEKLNKKIASCEDEAERLLLEEERFRKWL